MLLQQQKRGPAVTAPLVLMCDVGGTNTRLGLLQSYGASPSQVTTFRNADFGSFEDLLQAYLGKTQSPRIAEVILAVAAPVEGDVVILTNCDWQIATQSVCKMVGTKTLRIINDLEALALSLNHLLAPSIKHIAGPTRPADPVGRKLVLGVGTGFNAACAMGASTPVILPAECGHMTLPVETAEGLELRNFLARGRERASVERALSGQGLVDVYHWVAQSQGVVAKDLTAAQISTYAVSASDPLCTKAAHHVLTILATVMGDLVLAYLPYGGVYLAGSVARALAPLMAVPDFETRFAKKGRQSGLLQTFPISLITDDGAGLVGCAALASLRNISNMEYAQ